MTTDKSIFTELFDAIYDEAVHLLNLTSGLPPEFEAGLQRIISIARYKIDVLTEVEKLKVTK